MSTLDQFDLVNKLKTPVTEIIVWLLDHMAAKSMVLYGDSFSNSVVVVTFYLCTTFFCARHLRSFQANVQVTLISTNFSSVNTQQCFGLLLTNMSVPDLLTPL
jgi:hypothetical protein